MKKLTKVAVFLLALLAFGVAHAQTEVTYYTTMGNFKIMLTDTLTPRTVDSFIARVAGKFYDGLIFHRVIDGFMIQGGDPLGDGTGGPGYTTPDEFVPSLKNVPGALAMANSGPNTNGSQFFINLVTNSYLNNHYTVFGMVTTGFPVVQSIGHVATDSHDKPLTNVVIDSIRITSFASASVGSLPSGVAFSVFPNPSCGAFVFNLPATATSLEILNMAGQVVLTMQATATTTVDLSNQPKGLYVARISGCKGSAEMKLVLQ